MCTRDVPFKTISNTSVHFSKIKVRPATSQVQLHKRIIVSAKQLSQNSNELLLVCLLVQGIDRNMSDLKFFVISTIHVPKIDNLTKVKAIIRYLKNGIY